jgi:hypothetical protein
MDAQYAQEILVSLTQHPLGVCCVLSLIGYLLCVICIPKCGPYFVQAGLKGTDLAKSHLPVLYVVFSSLIQISYFL